MAAAETLNTGLDHSPKNVENFGLFYLLFVFLAIFAKFSSLGILHSLN